MSIVTATEFNQEPTAVKRRASLEPVFITDRGVATHVVLSIDEYRHLQRRDDSDLVSRISMDDYPDFEIGGEPITIEGLAF